MDDAYRVCEDVARHLGVPIGRVVLTYRVHSAEDGGPAWSVNVERQEGRRTVGYHASAEKLRDVSAEFVVMLARRAAR